MKWLEKVIAGAPPSMTPEMVDALKNELVLAKTEKCDRYCGPVPEELLPLLRAALDLLVRHELDYREVDPDKPLLLMDLFGYEIADAMRCEAHDFGLQMHPDGSLHVFQTHETDE